MSSLYEWGSLEWSLERNRKLLDWFGGDEDALAFLLSISTITELWDDLLDADKPITEQRVHEAFFQALVRMPCNPFYIKHREHLTPIIIQSINSWMDANIFEQGDATERTLAYTLRHMDLQLATAIVYLTQGYAKMREISPEMWRYFVVAQDDAPTWIRGDAS